MMTSIVADRTSDKKNTFKGCFIYSFKKDGSRYKSPTWCEAFGAKTPEEVLSRMQINNPNKKFELA